MHVLARIKLDKLHSVLPCIGPIAAVFFIPFISFVVNTHRHFFVQRSKSGEFLREEKSQTRKLLLNRGKKIFGSFCLEKNCSD